MQSPDDSDHKIKLLTNILKEKCIQIIGLTETHCLSRQKNYLNTTAMQYFIPVEKQKNLSTSAHINIII